MQAYRFKIGYVQQDPYGALSPFMIVQKILEEPLRISGVRSKEQRLERIRKVLGEVKLHPGEPPSSSTRSRDAVSILAAPKPLQAYSTKRNRPISNPSQITLWLAGCMNNSPRKTLRTQKLYRFSSRALRAWRFKVF